MTSAIKWEFQQLKGTVQQVNHNKTKEKNLLRSETEMKMKKKESKI